MIRGLNLYVFQKAASNLAPSAAWMQKSHINEGKM